MPNFWTKAGQFISEKISGTRTKDSDFDSAVEQMKNIEKGLISLRTFLNNFHSYTDNFKKYFSDFNSSLKLIYVETPYSFYTEEIRCQHQKIQLNFEDISKKINILHSKTSEWSIIFASAKEQIKSREEKRKVYDHYEGKLTKMNKSSKKDMKAIERNEDKFTKAASEYVDISEKTFETIKNSVKLAIELVNPIVRDIIINEQEFFKGITKTLDYFNDINDKFIQIKKDIENPNTSKDNITYDPMKYMSEKSLMKKICLNRTLTTTKFTKKVSNPLMELPNKNNQVMMRMSMKANKNGEQKYYGTKNYNNIYINSRMTNSFGEMTEKELEDFYNFQDDFD